MIEQLFGSKTRVKLLQLFYGNPNRSFYVREITRKIDEQINSVRRELANLLSIGIIASDTNTTDNRLYYEVNQSYEYYQPLLAIFGNGSMTKKTSAKKPGTPLSSERERLKKIGNIELALFTGKFTRDESSGIDLLIVGDINQHSFNKLVAEIEAQENRELRYTVFDSEEFEYRHKIKDRFVDTILAAKKQVLIDKNHLLG